MTKEARYVVITEGEIDALTVAEWGHPALSIPSGVKNLDWIEHDYDALTRFDRIFLFTDADEPGHACAEAIADRLGRERCFRVILPYGLKDANEAETSGQFCGPDFDECIAKARTLDPAELRNAAEMGGAVWDEMNPTEDLLGSELPWGFARIPWRARPNELTIWTGWSGHGKSHVLNQVVLHDYATTGSRVLIASLEMPCAETLTTIATMALARKPDSRSEVESVVNWLGGGFWFYDVIGTKKWQEMLPTFAYAVRRYGIKRIVLDSLLRVGINEDDYDGQKNFVQELIIFAAKHHVHIHLVAHSRKQDDESKPPGKFDVRGAAAITDNTNNGFTFWRNKQREHDIQLARSTSANGTVTEEITKKPAAKIICWKSRKLGDEPSLLLSYNSAAKQFCYGYGEVPRVYFNPRTHTQ